jgi:hypothetical protein
MRSPPKIGARAAVAAEDGWGGAPEAISALRLPDND